MPIKLKSSGGGDVTLDVPSTASTYTITVPAVTATALTDSAGVMNIGSGQIYKDASGNVGIGNTASNVNDQVGSVRPLLVSGSDSATTIAGSVASVVIGNSNTTTSNTSQLGFAAITGANSTYFTSAAINCVFGARTNGQYPTGQLVFSTSTSLNSAPTEKARIDAAGNWYMNSGYGSSAVAYGCRAWCTYNGVTSTIVASANISSVTKNSTGYYTINFTSSMPDANYSTQANVQKDDTNNDGNIYCQAGGFSTTKQTASATYMKIVRVSGLGACDSPAAYLAVFR